MYRWVRKEDQDYVRIALEPGAVAWEGPFPNMNLAAAWMDEQKQGIRKSAGANAAIASLPRASPALTRWTTRWWRVKPLGPSRSANRKP
jgi:hypothetical protein